MQADLIDIDPQLLEKYNQAVPRYTSYPTAPQFYEIDETLYREKLFFLGEKKGPVSLYFHIPFCRSMCLFCGCSVVLNRRPEKAEKYVTQLLKEIELVRENFSSKKEVSQIHFGGGTPTSLTEDQLERLFLKIESSFSVLKDAEISIEIDPRTVFLDAGRKLSFLKELGFNRVSFGVQDLDPVVQEAVRRRQSEEMTLRTYYKARALGFLGINVDLIYGLPYQSVTTFTKTAEKLLEMKPDRIAFYSYAKVPWLKKHQNAIPETSLPKTDEKFKIYTSARAQFMRGGYTAIGMDHFALSKDPLSLAYFNKKLTRNFQGYATELAENMIGFGLTAIGFLENGYFQNEKDLASYGQNITQKKLPTKKGYLLSDEDLFRKKIILSLMCHFEVEKKDLPSVDLSDLKKEGLIEEREDKIIATPLGRPLIRLIAAKFDAYLSKGMFSKAI